MGMGRVKPPRCPSCGIGGTDGHRHNVNHRIYEREGSGMPYRGIGWRCPNGHLFTDQEAARFAALVHELASSAQG